MNVHELEVDSVLKNYGGVQVLTNVYLQCKTGDVVGLLGRNGSGKSTLLKIIFGSVDTPDKSIRIDKKVYPEPYREKKLVAYLPQHSFLPKGISLKRIAAIFLEDRERKEAVLGNERIKKHINKTATALSGGERRYFEVLLLVNLPVRFVLLDEPFSAIEPLYKEAIQELIYQYKSEKGFIITDHDYRSIIEVSNRLILLSNGVCRHIKRTQELEELNYLPKGTLTKEGKQQAGDITPQEDTPFEADEQTLRDLGLFDSTQEGSLYSIFAGTRTKGGRNALDRILCSPSQSLEVLEARSDAIRYMQENRPDLLIDRKQVEFVEHYITSTIHLLRKNYLDAFLTHVKNSYNLSNDYYIITTGIRNTVGFIKYLENLLPQFQHEHTPHALSHLCFRVQNILSKREVKELVASYADERMHFFRIGEYDYSLRQVIKNDVLELLDFLYKLDAYVAVASTAESLQLTYPEYLNSPEPTVEIQGLFHPMVQHAVPNDFTIRQAQNLCFLTGANMSGKSTFLKSFGLCIYLAHVGFPVPASGMRTTVFNGIITTINLSDNINKGYSHFYSEVRRVKETAVKLKKNKKLVVIFDELFRGTNVKDASDASLMIIAALSNIQTSLFLVSTHIVEIAEELKKHRNIFFACFDTKLQDQVPVYDYRLKEGVSKESLGLHIVRNEGIVELLAEASQEQTATPARNS
ncbi:MutS-related protein [Botryobacter ruber]|uniref:MutS-related protein n=1 Tax=Botryobacter ruber TaxID=2171629 RepID=UPI000E0B8B83|nr:ATP-binding cassette domain-containing protein [Botryobacter ruber]